MAAIATSKPGATTATQLTFPAVFQDVYASQHRPLQYAPSARGPVVAPMAGDDFQSHYHAQKKMDADYMARAKVEATRNARKRMLLSHQNYYGMPDPSLAQRQFANGSAGAYILNSARQTNTTAPFQLVEAGLSGGVLRTAEGQAYGKARLLDRINQLNAIDAESQRFLTGEAPLAPSMGAETLPTAPSAPVSQNAKVELQLLLKAIIDALMGDTARKVDEKDELSRFTFSDSVRALSLIIRVASSPDTDAETLEDIKAPVDSINQLLSGLTDPDRREQVELTEMAKERLITTAELFQRIGEYVDGMMGGVNLSPRERQALSKNLVKSLGFTQFARQMEQQRVENRGFYERVARTRLFDAGGRQAMDDDDDDDADDRFDTPATSRENTEQGSSAPRSAFDGDERQTLGYSSGSWFSAPAQQGRQAPTFLGEERPALPELGERRTRVLEPAPDTRGRSNAAPSAEIRGVYDPVLGARGVEVIRPSPRPVVIVPAPRSRTTRSTASSARAVRRGAPAPPAIPTRQSELPTTREGFDALARAINAAGGIDGQPIRVYSAGRLENIRRNFIRRLGLTGKY